jgi:formamidopyrimidine-DNA glycosylase
MPELPEVETIVRELKTKVLSRTFVDVWTDFKKVIKKPGSFESFKKEIRGKKIAIVWRRGKNVIFNLSGGRSLLIHQKLTGHLMFGKWKLEHGAWKSLIKGPLTDDSVNNFIHLLFFLDNGYMLALSDLRKFAKAELWKTDDLLENGFEKMGPEPLEKGFTFEKFKERLKNKKGKIKQVLMDQNVIAGIGNIYSDEILFGAKIHPLKEVGKIKENELKRVYGLMQDILKKAIEVKGESFSDFRTLSGEKGGFDPFRKVYRREGEKCSRCGAVIERIKTGGRSAHFCPNCQKLLK